MDDADWIKSGADSDEEEFCYYCAEPLENGLCSAHCHESEDDEGRECECEDKECNT